MSYRGTVAKLKHLPLSKAITYFGAGALVLLVGSYAFWKMGRYFSPETIINSSNPTIKYRNTDHSSNQKALPNSFTDSTAPDYGDNISSAGPTVLSIDANGNIVLPRFQGEVEYY